MRATRFFLPLLALCLSALFLAACSAPAAPAQQQPTETVVLPEETTTAANTPAMPEITPLPSLQDQMQTELEQIDGATPFEPGYYDYAGTIGNDLAVRMSLYPKDGGLVGWYLYDSQMHEISLHGKAGDHDLLLIETDERGSCTGVFRGTLSGVDRITGTWRNASGSNSFAFTLALQHILPNAQYGKRYAVALGTKTDADVVSFASAIQQALRTGDKETVANAISFPINVITVKGKLEIRDRETFLAQFDQIFHDELKKAVCGDYVGSLFANADGILLGEGQYNLWINELTTDSGSKLAITAINN